MIANIWGEPTHLEETVSTLRFASRVRQLTTELSMAESDDPALLLKKYERQVGRVQGKVWVRVQDVGVGQRAGCGSGCGAGCR